MKRRDFIATLGGAVVLPCLARAQRSKLPTVGFLGGSTPLLASQRTVAFEQRLRELGWTEGRTIALEYRWAEGRLDRSPALLGEFVRLNVDVIVTHATANVIAARQATSTIPIVFAVAADPVGTGLVASLARPGGNVTGLSLQATDLAGKRLEILREFVPRLQRLEVLVNIDNPASALEMREVEAAAHTLGVSTVMLEIRRAEDIAAVFDTLQGGAQAIYVCADPLVNANRTRISTLALGARLPTMQDNREFVQAGGLLSYGPNITDMFRRAADYVDKILRGAKPAELPVEQPTRFDLIVNLTTAKALGLVLPSALLARADEVIE
jgi:putative ABC transport system substrate-binding protein